MELFVFLAVCFATDDYALKHSFFLL